MIKDVIILGFSSIGKEIIEIIDEMNKDNKQPMYRCIGFLDDNNRFLGRSFKGIEVLGNLGMSKEFVNECFFVNAIASQNNYYFRDKIVNELKIPEKKFINVIHKSAQISKFTRIGKGCIVMQNAVITQEVTIGNHVVISANCVINHSVIISDYSILASGVNIAGNTRVGKLSYLGMGSSIIGGIEIGSKVLVGMGSVVVKNIADRKVFVGNPARCIKELL
ncbi:acetyltransferase [bacterium LRH843]|nr:acetyltransferase [bacterium LRH843]